MGDLQSRSEWCTGTVAVMVVLLASIACGQVEVWTSRYDPGYDRTDEATAMAITLDEDLILSGLSVGLDNTWDVLTMRLDGESGETLWVRRWTGGAGIWEKVTAVAVDSAGSVFVTGYGWGPARDTNYLTLKYSADGILVWAAPYLLTRGDRAMAVVADNNGGVYVTGSCGDTLVGHYDWVTLHYRADGGLDWSARYNGPMGRNDFATALTIDRAGDLYVCGYSWTDALRNYDLTLVKYSPQGETLWARRYDGTEPISPKDDYGFGVAVDAENNVYVVGRAGESGNYYDAVVVTWSSTGARRWVNRLDWGENAMDGVHAISIAPGGSVLCGGFTETSLGVFDMLVYSLGTDSLVDWMRSYNYVNDDDSVVAVCTDSHGNLYVAGYSYSLDGDIDWVVAKYTSEGSQVWLVRHSVFDEDDVPCGIATDRLGNIFVGGFDWYEGSCDYALTKFSEYDVGAGRIASPADTFRLGATVTPRVWVRNYSALELTFPMRLEIGQFYFDQRNVPSLAPYDSVLVSFLPWYVRDTGRHIVRCYTMLNGDKETTNDTVLGACTGVNVWELLPPVPPGPRNKDIKDGACLVPVRDSLVFALKGNNTVEYYKYNTTRAVWHECESIPAMARSGRKRVKSGARLAHDRERYVYALKGNNTAELWRYSVDGDSWRQMADIPSGVSGRRVKKGAGMTYVPWKNMLFVVKGANTSEVFGYFPNGDSWRRLKDVPLGPSGKRRVKDGSCLSWDGDSTIYLLKGGCYEFYAFRLGCDSWIQRKDLRDAEFTNPKRRKPKKGAGLACDPQFRRVYASKGGKQTEWWYFDIVRDTWVETWDTFPRWPTGRGPAAGADLGYGNGKVYALKGNKTREFWRYNANFPLNPPANGEQGVKAAGPTLRLRVAPNPVSVRTLVRYVLPVPGKVSLTVYDVSGRLCAQLFGGVQVPGEHSLPLAAERMANGVYLVRLELVADSGDYQQTQKFLVVR